MTLLKMANENIEMDQQIFSNPSGSNWGLGYLAQYFDVTTRDVYERILWSAVPIRKSATNNDDPELEAPLATNMESDEKVMDGGDRQINPKRFSYIERFIQGRPDLYGPFWISITLIFSIALFSNIDNYWRFKLKIEDMIESLTTPHNGTIKPPEDLSPVMHLENLKEKLAQWHYSLEELNMATSLIIFYVIFVPFLVWCLFRFRGCAKYYTLTEIICAYGYSLSIFIPVCVLLMFQSLLFRYLVIALAATLSGLPLMLSFLPVVHSDPNKAGSRLILVLVPVGQFFLAFLVHRIMLNTEPSITTRIL